MNKGGNGYEIKFFKKEDLPGLNSEAKGNIVEYRVQELLLDGKRRLNVFYFPARDTEEGVYLFVAKNGKSHPISIQVKRKFGLHDQMSLSITVRSKTLPYKIMFSVVGEFFNPETLEIEENIFLVPSELADANKENPENDKYKGKLSKYLIKKSDLMSKLIEHFDDKYEVLR